MSYLLALIHYEFESCWQVIARLNDLTSSEFRYFKSYYGLENLRLQFIYDNCIFEHSFLNCWEPDEDFYV